MKLKLKNFRCHENIEFNFSDKGLILLSGISGRGKSSILNAINFVLFDVGTKIVKHDKTHCSVEFEFQDMVITRTKKPNRLVLKQDETEYEDEVAQKIINEKFGVNFDIISYVQQNNFKSFILMSPLDKLAFLEKFAFESFDSSKLKAKVKNLITQYNEKLISVSSQLKLSQDVFQNMEIPKEIPFPIDSKSDSKKNRDIAILNEYTRKKNTETLLKRNTNALFLLKQELDKTQNYLKLIQILNEEEDKLEIEKLSEKLSKINFEKDDYIYFQNLLEFLKIEKEKEKEEEEWNYQLSELKKQTFSSTLEENTEVLNSLKEMLNDKRKIMEYSTKMKKLENGDIELLEDELEATQKIIVSIELRKKSYTCPNCRSRLQLNNQNALELIHSDFIDNNCEVDEQLKRLENIKKQIESAKKYNEYNKNILEIEKSYEEKLPDINDIIQNIQEVEQEIQNIKENNNKISELNKKIKNKIYSKHLQEKIKRMDEVYETDLTIEEVEIQLKELEKNEIIFTSLKKQKIEKEQMLFKKQQDIQNNKLENIRDIQEIKKDIESKEYEFRELEKKLEIHNNNIVKIEEYQEYLKKLEPWNEWKSKVENLLKEEEKYKDLYAASLKLKDKITITESIILQNILDSINSYMNHFLESFFPDSPINVILSTTKETKSGEVKNQINIMVHYKEMETDISTLSGGEISRVVLACALSLSTIFSSKLILLDECTSSLNIELNDIVLETIKKEFSDKLVLIISHQVSTHAIFDQVIHV